MPKPNKEWKVLPHGALTELDKDLYCVVGGVPMPLVRIPRRMTVVRLSDGRLIIWSPVSVAAQALAKLEALGKPAFLIVPSDHHRLDVAAWKTRYPAAMVVTPPGSRENVAKVVAVDTTSPNFGDADVNFVGVAGTRDEESALLIHRNGATTLVLNDIVGNIRNSSGIGGWILRRMGLAGEEAQVPKAVALLIIKDKAALKNQLMQWAQITDLKRIIVSHGDIIETDPRGLLRDLAQRIT